jgi:hypothetical protein
MMCAGMVDYYFRWDFDMPHQSESEVSAIARAATDYRAAGWSVVPLRPRNKRPLIEWERFQHELASSATVTE